MAYNDYFCLIILLAANALAAPLMVHDMYKPRKRILLLSGLLFPLTYIFVIVRVFALFCRKMK